jgi:hypothetical protein
MGLLKNRQPLANAKKNLAQSSAEDAESGQERVHSLILFLGCGSVALCLGISVVKNNESRCLCHWDSTKSFCISGVFDWIVLK